jgi:hydroxylamine reductase
VAVLLSLLHLGVKGIRIGPAAPGWLTPHVAQVLKDAYDLDVIGSDPVADVRRVMAA